MKATPSLGKQEHVDTPSCKGVWESTDQNRATDWLSDQL
jgi:hypothetical protein